MKTIEQYIEAEMNGKITRKKNSPLPSILVLACGIGLMVLLRTVGMGDTLGATCLTLGLITTAVGIVLTAMSLTGAMSHFVYLPTRSRMCDKKVYISSDDCKLFSDALAQGDVKQLKTITRCTNSNSLLRIVASRDGACALVQAGRNDTGHFEPDTDVHLLSGAETIAIQNLIK